MGCYVNFATAGTRPRSTTLKIAVFLQILRGAVFLAISFLFSPLFAGIAFIEFIIAWWLWTQRVEAWGVAVGFSLFHIIFPLTLGASEVVFTSIAALVAIEILCLIELQRKGYYNFNFLVKYDPNESIQISGVQSMMFRFVILAQVLKVMLLVMGAYIVSGYELLYGLQVWYGVPQIPLILLLTIIEIIATSGFYMRRNWAFHMVLILSALSFAETMIAWSFLIVLLGIWVITLLMPCWVKWVIYAGILDRYRARSEDTDNSKVELVYTPKK